MQLSVAPPKEAAANTYRFAVVASGEREQARLPIELTVKEKLPPSLALSVDLPTIQGGPDSTFSYNTTLKNEGDEDLTVNLIAQAPQGFQVSFKLSGQDVTNVPLAANESKPLTVEAKAFDQVPAGAYQFDVQAQADKAQAETRLVANVIGQSQLSVSAPDGRLSGQAYVGNTTPFSVILQNTGSASARNIKLSASPPAGWSVTFTPDQIAEVPSGQQVEVTANIKPTDQAVAGDYMVSVTAQPEGGSSKSVDFRITVLLSSHLLPQVQAICDRVGLFNHGQLAIEGTVVDLARQVLGGAYRVHLEAEGAPELETTLRQLDGVVGVARPGPNVYAIEATNDLRADVARAVVETGGRLLALNIETPSLDEIYTRYFREVDHVVAA